MPYCQSYEEQYEQDIENELPNNKPRSQVIYGCTDPDANNYNCDATEDDNTCTYDIIYGCTDPDANNYDETATQDQIPTLCTYDPEPVIGCMNPEANNYNMFATEDAVPSLCTFDPEPVYGCMDQTASNYLATATHELPNSCIYIGCMNPSATNYDSRNTSDTNPSSCIFPPPSTPIQYTPETTLPGVLSGTAMLAGATTRSQAVSSVDSQDPDGIKWINPQRWIEAQWDGIPFDITGKTKTQVCLFIRPTSQSQVIRGLREKFYEVNPFADVTNPQPHEIENWHIEVIKHYRALFGVTTPIKNDARLYLEARWADERSHLEAWDVEYPSSVSPYTPKNVGDHWGPCFVNGSYYDRAAGHCGASFRPDATDRQPYIDGAPYLNDTTKYPELSLYGPLAVKKSATEGLASVNADYPWSIKFAHVIANYICAEGLNVGGHADPITSTNGGARQLFGCHWWYDGTNNNGYRGKWADPP
jgi:hypothetical protein